MSVKAAIDLLWVRPKQVGGIESYIRNLLDGFSLLDDNFEFWLLVSTDNAGTFAHYGNDARFHLCICSIESINIGKRIIWQNLNLGKVIKNLGLKTCFEPYYCKPFCGTHKIKFITTIHDLQAIHYPKYFSKSKVIWMKLSWNNTIKTSEKIIAISEYVKNDIIKYYKVSPDKITTIYNPIILKPEEITSIEDIEKKYNVKRKEYYFTVSSLLPHKNVHTLIRVFAEIKKLNTSLPCQLIVSGIGGKSKTSLEKLIKINDLENNIQLTTFIDNSERNTLYKYCKAFLFPSVFEGFGMPPIEAMYLGVPVITTRMTCLEEITQGKANYVDNPYDVAEWIAKMRKLNNRDLEIDFSKFQINKIAKQYLQEIETIEI